jgi:ribosome-binding ATPase
MIIGLVGAPSAGKSTFFKASTLSEVEIANYPFTTIEKNEGMAYVKIDCVDKEFNTQCNPRFGQCLDHKRFVPIKIIDVAGLVPGAHAGKGRGNQFLDDLNQANALIHVIDVSGSTTTEGEPVAPGTQDPVEIIKFLETELDMWYLGILEKGWAKFARQVQQEKLDINKSIAKQLSGLRVTEEIAKEATRGLSKQVQSWSEEDLITLAKALRRITKPMLIAANKIDIPGSKENLEKIKKEFPDHIIIGCSAESELALKEAAKKDLIKYIPGEDNFEILNKDKLSENQQKALSFIKTNILEQFKTTGVQGCLNKAVFDLLEMIAIFPGGVNNLTDKNGNTLPDCFLLEKDSTALDFAFHLHTDIGKGFIKAINVKTKVSIGKDHKLNNRDVIEIKTRA